MSKVVAEEKASIIKSDSLRGSLKLDLDRPADPVDNDEEEDDNDRRPILGSNLYMDSPRVGRVDDDVSEEEIKRRHYIGVATVSGVFLSILLCVVFLHYLSHHESFSALPPTQQRFMATTSTGGIRESLEQYTAGVRHTGSAGDQEMAKYIRAKAIDFGIEERFVKLEEFEILVNEPETLKLTIDRTTGGPIKYDFMANFTTPKKNQRTPYPPFHLYARNGTAKGPLVYAHYGRSEDYAALKMAGVELKGAILLIRMGEISLPAKVVIAGKHGAAGVLTYHDPADDGAGMGKTYPDGPWRVTSEASFGSVYMGNGDPSSPDGFSASQIDRISVDEVFSPNNTYNIMPSVVSMPVSAKVAADLLRAINASSANGKNATQVFGVNWKGGAAFALNGTKPAAPKLDNYLVGPSNLTITIENKNKYSFKKVWNVLITIRGSREADRYVIVGAQRDSLNAGAASPGSGNAVFIELLRAIGELLTNGWVPHRTLLLASFDGEQFGSVGSSEWIDRHFTHLGGRGVAYLHLRDVVRGAGPLHCEAAASLRKSIYLMSTEVKQPKIEVAVDKFASGAAFIKPSSEEDGEHDSEEKDDDSEENKLGRVLVAASSDGTVIAKSVVGGGAVDATAGDEDLESSLLPLNTTFGHEDLPDSGDSIFAAWLAGTRMRTSTTTAKLPKVHLPGADNKISPFLARLGIPSVELGFDGGYYGVENSRNDTMEWIKKFADPSFTFHRAAAQLYGSLLLTFSDAVFLQYDFTEVARDLRYGEAYLADAIKRTVPDAKISTTRLTTAIGVFEQAALGVVKEIHEMKQSMINLINGELVVDLKRVREMNTRLLMTEKAFLLPAGLPHMPWLKHALYGISQYDDYRVGYFPGVAQEIIAGNAVSVKRELIRLCQTIEQAADILSTTVL